MKRTVYVAAGMLALTTAIVVTAQLRAQTAGAQPQARPAAPTTKVAIVNLTVISKKYEKVKTFNEEVKTAAEPFVKADKKLKDDYEALVKRAQTATPADREKLEAEVKAIQRQAEDNKNTFQKTVGKKNEDQLKILYYDLYAVVQRVATARGYELVMHYNDAMPPVGKDDKDDFWGAPNIARKMQMGSLMPLYYVGGIDISEDVVATLNAQAKQPPATGQR